MSKAALNMANKNLSLEHGRGKSRYETFLNIPDSKVMCCRVLCLCLHPGTTDTDLSRPYHKGVPKDKLFSTQFSVMKMMEVVDGVSMEDTGRFIAWDGQDIQF